MTCRPSATLPTQPDGPGVHHQNFAAYVNQNFDRQDFNVSDMSRQMNLSSHNFYRKVKALLGQSIRRFHSEHPFEKAEELLLAGDYRLPK